jgi:hypothetical protein
VEIPLGVHESHGYQRDPEITAFLEMVPCEESKTPCIERKRMMQSVLSGKIGDGERSGGWMGLREPSVMVLHVPGETIHDDIVAAKIFGISDNPVQELVGNVPEHLHRVMDALPPGMRIDLLEEDAGFRVPAPPEVVGEISQSSYPIGDRGSPLPVYQFILHKWS